LLPLAAAVVAAVRSDADSGSASKGSPWELKLLGLQCMHIETAPFHAFQAKWPKCHQEAVDKGVALAEKGNCRLCDLEMTGSKPEAEQSWASTGCKVEVKCSAVRLRPSAATCFDGHGKLGAVRGLNDGAPVLLANPEKACLPCPEACKECGISTLVGFTQHAYKCVLPAQGTPETGETCEKPPLGTCKPCEHRTCSWDITSLGCNTHDFKTTCEYPAFDGGQAAGGAQPPEDYELTVKAGSDKGKMPEILDILHQQ